MVERIWAQILLAHRSDDLSLPLRSRSADMLWTQDQSMWGAGAGGLPLNSAPPQNHSK